MRLLLLLFFLSACTSPVVCESGVFADGKCCAYVCPLECPSGYVKGTCNCECNPSLGIDAFEEYPQISPPALP